VAHIDQVDQARPQEIILLGVAGFRLHRHIRKIAGFSPESYETLRSRSHKKPQVLSRNQQHADCSGRTL
jgi:hypothetical protein